MTRKPFNAKDATVLVVEDNPNDATLTVRALQTFGIKNISHAGTAEDAVDFLHSKHCDVVLVDFNLPGMNGLRLLPKVRDLDPAAIVIFVTGVRDEKVAVEALQNGASDYVSKDELLTSGIINALQNALRARDGREVAHQSALLAEDQGSSRDVALAEADWLLSPAGGHLIGPTRLASVTSDDIAAQDARDAFARYLEASMSGGPFDVEEEGLVRLIVERGASPRDIVTWFRSAVRVLQIDTKSGDHAGAIRPSVSFARVLLGLVDAYQGELSAQTFAERGASVGLKEAA